MIDEIVATRAGGSLRVALREAGRLMEVLFEGAETPGAVGDIVLGRVTTMLRGLDACFVDIGCDRAGFLSLAARDGAPSEGVAPGGTDAPTSPEPPAEGATVLVQVTKAAQAGKGCGLTRGLSLAGRYLVFLPGGARITVSRRIADADVRTALERALAAIAAPGEGLIARTAAAGVSPEALAVDADALRARWQEIAAAAEAAAAPARLHTGASGLAGVLRDRAHAGIRRVIVDTGRDEDEARTFFAEYLPEAAARIERWRGDEPAFEAYGIADDLAAALESEVGLPCGGSIVIEETHALTAIDVNTGRNTGTGGGGHAETVRATNLEAAVEIARQLRLRALGGLTVIDFVHMEDAAHRAEVLAALTAALAEDPAFIRVTGFSELGLIELARRRGAGSLRERLEALQRREGAA